MEKELEETLKELRDKVYKEGRKKGIDELLSAIWLDTTIELPQFNEIERVAKKLKGEADGK